MIYLVLAVVIVLLPALMYLASKPTKTDDGFEGPDRPAGDY